MSKSNKFVSLNSPLGYNVEVFIENGLIYSSIGDPLNISQDWSIATIDLACLKSVSILAEEKPETIDTSNVPVGAAIGGLIAFGLTKSFGWAGAGALIGLIAAERKTDAKPAIIGIEFGDGSKAAFAVWPEELAILQTSARNENAHKTNPLRNREMAASQKDDANINSILRPLFGVLLGVVIIFVPRLLGAFDDPDPAFPFAISLKYIFPLLGIFVIVLGCCISLTRLLDQNRNSRNSTNVAANPDHT